jgi:hypothetical protein
LPLQKTEPVSAISSRYNDRSHASDRPFMKVTLTPAIPFELNCSVPVCEAARHAAVVDPGVDIAWERRLNWIVGGGVAA